MAIWAREEAEFARTEAECSKEKAEEEAYDAGVAETEAALKAQFPGVCRIYCSQVWDEALKRAGVDASSDLWEAECVFYPSAIKEDATPSAAQEIISPQVFAKGSGPSGMVGADESQDPDTPKETAGFVSGDPVSHIEGPVIATEPLQSLPLAKGSKDPEISPAQPSLEGIEDKSPT